MKKRFEVLYKMFEERFEANYHRHKDLKWQEMIDLILLDENLVRAYVIMQETGGEPDILLMNENIYICDFSKDSPNRRSLCYDEVARKNRKKFPPESSAQEFAKRIGGRMLETFEYEYIQSLEDMDLKSSSWLNTPKDVREKGGALFGDKRYGRTFIYHNGADSYYASRGVRVLIKIK